MLLSREGLRDKQGQRVLTSKLNTSGSSNLKASSLLRSLQTCTLAHCRSSLLRATLSVVQSVTYDSTNSCIVVPSASCRRRLVESGRETSRRPSAGQSKVLSLCGGTREVQMQAQSRFLLRIHWFSGSVFTLLQDASKKSSSRRAVSRISTLCVLQYSSTPGARVLHSCKPSRAVMRMHGQEGC